MLPVTDRSDRLEPSDGVEAIMLGLVDGVGSEYVRDMNKCHDFEVKEDSRS